MKPQETAATLLHTLLESGTTASLTDSQLLERFATGDRAPAETAFHALVDRHAAMVFRTCRNILGDEHEARDASQATFLILFRRGRSIWVGSSLGPWLHRIACRTARRARARAARRRDLERRVADRRVGAVRAPELVAAIHDELDHLPARFRVPIILCDLEGHTREEAARRIGCPLGTLASRLARGRDRLRDRLIRRGLTPSSSLITTLLSHGPVIVPVVVARPLVIISPTVARLARGLVQQFAISKLVGSSLVLLGGLGLASTGMVTQTPGPDPAGPSSPASQVPGKTASSAALPSDRPIPQPTPIAQNPPQLGTISFAGQVVEFGTTKPVAGAELVVNESRPGTPVPQGITSTLRSDPTGRFTLIIPMAKVVDPDQVEVSIRIKHPDFIAVQSFFSLARLTELKQAEQPSPFKEISLERPRIYTAQVIGPAGKPAPGVPYRLINMSREFKHSAFIAETEFAGQTDAEGRIQQPMPATSALLLRLEPTQLAPWQRFWGDDFAISIPPPAVPRDLGEIRLDPGVTLDGRLLDLGGKPVAGQTLTAIGRLHSFRRSATTAEDGRFVFPPLRPGNYLIEGAGQDNGWSGGHPDAPVAPPDALIIQPVPVYLTNEGATSPLEIREAATVAVAVRFINSQGQPAPGVPVALHGYLPGAGGDTRMDYELWPETGTPAQWYKDPESRLTGGRLDWATRLPPADGGVVRFQVPRGLREAEINAYPGDEQTAFKIRLEPGGPLEWRPHHVLGQLDADRTEIEVVVYRSPQVKVQVRIEGGEPIPPGLKVHQGENIRGGDYGTDAIRQLDGSFQTRNLVPDQETEIRASASGYVPRGMERLTLVEGAEATIDLVIRPQPKPPAVGDVAPPFRVTTLDGQVRSLADYRGKFLLIHVWSPFFELDRDLPRLDAIRQRWGEDRLALLGLSITADTLAATQTISDRGITWPQAVLRDRGSDPLMLDYNAMYPPKSFLIGPDGKLVARDLTGDAVDAAVARSLGSEGQVR